MKTHRARFTPRVGWLRLSNDNVVDAPDDGLVHRVEQRGFLVLATCGIEGYAPNLDEDNLWTSDSLTCLECLAYGSES